MEWIIGGIFFLLCNGVHFFFILATDFDFENYLFCVLFFVIYFLINVLGTFNIIGDVLLLLHHDQKKHIKKNPKLISKNVRNQKSWVKLERKRFNK